MTEPLKRSQTSAPGSMSCLNPFNNQGTAMMEPLKLTINEIDKFFDAS